MLAPSAAAGATVATAAARPVTDAALGTTRVVVYVATAVLIGGVAFLALVAGPALAATAPRSVGPRAAEALAANARRLFLWGLAAGAIATALGIVLQASAALGGSFWDALRPAVIADSLSTRFGATWGLRLVDLGVVAVLLLGAATGLRYRALLPARLGAGGAGATAAGPRRPVTAVALGVALCLLVLVPAFGGHAGVIEPRWPRTPVSFVHVLSFALWGGGLVAMLVCLPAATRELEGADRTRLQAAAVGRFSTLALAAVAGLLVSGIARSVLELGSWGELTATGYGRAILIKAGLFSGLIALGAYNRQRLLPAIRSAIGGSDGPGKAALALRRSVRAEVVLIGGVLAATAVLAGLTPPAAT
ncbi:MAG: hypothetical protein GEU88_16295 [Solirubrobacterales bacterium]|nr:hypothetical protein [Solirubrobacterales bacterium]